MSQVEPIFRRVVADGTWEPSALARGPFAGLQGGAVAGLLAGEIEARADASGWGQAVSAAAWFLRPIPMNRLRTQVVPLRVGGRVSVVDNTLWVEGEDEPCATVRVTLMQSRPVEVAGFVGPAETVVDPSLLGLSARPARHGDPWFMDAMEARAGGGVSWFRMKAPVMAGAGPLAQALGPADWAHGVSRPVWDVVADPNPNLTVHLARPPRGDWLGLQPTTHWTPELSRGAGAGLLSDTRGVVGSVSMAVALTAFRPARVEA
ncbi:acyl-CoA thioesterase domain-containing protein [Phenylobacterium sp.]|uniref:acyl-CoA thioesterase domain-containing protein n=1 Tax=Phenylobacterium sp. TaxID=1871053 RepID=UPI002733583D|nr:acyl-CoA thioesterase domain-containing protein [Phenylobacterium sp.]MDP3852098.1 thioesterase family protein [Phenylobacterium sp.]